VQHFFETNLYVNMAAWVVGHKACMAGDEKSIGRVMSVYFHPGFKEIMYVLLRTEGPGKGRPIALKNSEIRFLLPYSN